MFAGATSISSITIEKDFSLAGTNLGRDAGGAEFAARNASHGTWRMDNGVEPEDIANNSVP